MSKYFVMILGLFFVSLFMVGCTESESNQSDIGPSGIKDSNVDLPPEPPYIGIVPEDGSIATMVSSSDLAQHDSEDDCWVAYQGSVYDVTDFLPMHPGTAAAITPYCGMSSGFEDAFTTKHGIKQVSTLEKMGVYKGQLQ